VPNDSAFRRLPETARPQVTINVDGRPVAACEGDTVAAAVLAAGIVATRRTPVSGAPRGPFCMMGACFECLMEIDGVPNRQACTVEVRDGMVVRAMAGARGAVTGERDD
jgi:predicted molibdopterin-dependent oxidoreductase YjgC